MTARLLIAAGFIAVAYVLWSFMEYVLHRFAFHEARGKNYGSREHLGHHARRDYDFFKNWEAWVGVVLVGARPVRARLVAGRPRRRPVARPGLRPRLLHLRGHPRHRPRAPAPAPVTAAGSASTTSTTTSPSPSATRA